MLTEVRAVFFDLDGTLVDTVPDLAMAVDRMMAQLGLPLRGEAAVRHWVGNGVGELVHRALTNSMEGRVDEALHARALALFEEAYRERLSVDSRLYEGVQQGLESLRDRGLILAVVTNKHADFACPLLDGIGIGDYFDLVVGGEATTNKKPAPDPLLLAADLLGVDIADSLMVGDSENDVCAARNAGCPVVCVPYGYNYGRDIRDSRPDAVIASLADLETLLAHRPTVAAAAQAVE